jgi:preprotein translocase subunit SecD
LSGLFCFEAFSRVPFAALALTVLIRAAVAEPVTIEVVSAEIGFDRRNGEAIVSFRMSSASQAAFTRFTRQNVGRKIELRVDGKTVTAPVIREPILGDVGQLSGHFTERQARDIADGLSSGRSRLEMELAP